MERTRWELVGADKKEAKKRTAFIRFIVIVGVMLLAAVNVTTSG